MIAESELGLFRYDPSIVPREIEKDFKGLKARVITEQHGQLNLTRLATEDTRLGKFFKRILSADDAQGSIDGRIVFVRVKRLFTRGDKTIRYIVWELRPECPGQFVSLKLEEQAIKTHGELFVGFLTADSNLARGATYDLTTGKLREQHWGKRVGNSVEFGRHLEYWSLDETEDKYCFYGTRGDHKERIVFPKTLVDAEHLLEEIIDNDNNVVSNPNLPWTSWFRRMGIMAEYLQ